MHILYQMGYLTLMLEVSLFRDASEKPLYKIYPVAYYLLFFGYTSLLNESLPCVLHTVACSATKFERILVQIC